jgi:flagellar motor switch protein FliM
MLTQAEIDALLSGSLEVDQGGHQGHVNLANLMNEPAAASAESPAAESQPAAAGPARWAPSAPGETARPPRPTATMLSNGKTVRPYNFWSPDYFSKDQMRAVELVHEDLAERLTSSLPSFLRTNLRPRVVHTEQGRFHDFVKDLSPSSLFHLITLSPLPGQMVMTISPEVSYVILEQRLGGQVDRGNKKRNLTEIDQALLRTMVEHMLNDIKASWSKVVAIEPGLEDSTVNQHWVQMVVGNERVMLIAFEFTIQSITGMMNIYIPFTMLKPIVSVLNPHVWITGRKERQADPEARRTAAQNLAQVSVPFRVYLGHAKVPMANLLSLRPGDVIPLETSTSQELPVFVADRTCFMVRVGKVGSRLAAQITNVLDEVGELQSAMEQRAAMG